MEYQYLSNKSVVNNNLELPFLKLLIIVCLFDASMLECIADIRKLASLVSLVSLLGSNDIILNLVQYFEQGDYYFLDHRLF